MRNGGDRKQVFGGLDLGGTKIQAVLLDEEGNVLGQARRVTPQKGGPPAIVEELFATLQEAARAAEAGALGARGSGSGGSRRGGSGDGRAAAGGQPPRLGGALSAGGCALEAGEGAGVPGQRRAGGGGGRGSPRRGASLPLAARGVVGNGRGRWHRTWMASAGRGAARRGRSATSSCGEAERAARAAGAAAWRRTRGRAAMERRARKAVERGEKTRLFELMETHGKDRLTSGIWLRALKQEDGLAERLIARALRMLGAGIASAVNLLDVEAVIIGGGLGTRLGEPYVERISQAHAPPPLRVPAATGRAARGARRAVGSHRRGAARRAPVRGRLRGEATRRAPRASPTAHPAHH